VELKHERRTNGRRVCKTFCVFAAYPRSALFSAAETDDWPDGTLDHLLECGILQRADRAEAVVCPGCIWQCHKPIVVRTVAAGQRRQAFIVCDEEPDLGRQDVSLRSLSQYRATIDNLSVFFADQMELGPTRASPNGNSFLLGTIKGRHGPRQSSISLIGGQLQLRVGRQLESVARILHWDGACFSIDMAHIRRLANRKEGAQASRASHLSDRTRQQGRSRETRARHLAIFRRAKELRAAEGGSWTAIANAIAAGDHVKDEQGRRLKADTMRRIISEMLRLERVSSRSNRKVRK
jgi:hypothetical protein